MPEPQTTQMPQPGTHGQYDNVGYRTGAHTTSAWGNPAPFTQNGLLQAPYQAWDAASSEANHTSYSSSGPLQSGQACSE